MYPIPSLNYFNVPIASTTASLQLWDIGGQSIGSKMITNYISGAHAVLLCYDITNYESFVNLEDWLRMVIKAFGDKPMPLLALIGNKSDLRHLTAVKSDQHNAFAEENKMCSFIMSAKSGDQINNAFLRLASMLANVTLNQKDLEGIANVSVVPAKIVNHERHDKDVNDGKVPDAQAQTKKSSCAIS